MTAPQPSDPWRRVLVVDDEPDIRLLIGRFLEAHGFELETAADGAEALAAVKRFEPDVVLLDLEMPVMDGWAFLRACRATPELVDLPVIVMTARFGGGESLADLDVRGQLNKPFDLDALEAALELPGSAASDCSVCRVWSGTHALTVFEGGGSVQAPSRWHLCGNCWHLLEAGFHALGHRNSLRRYIERPGLYITETEVRGFISAGLTTARRRVSYS